jgi:7-cyano-7-deazaguanine synthase in queuosine biosynthesis
VYLRTNAKLYKGLSIFFDSGYSESSSADGDETESTTVRSGTNVIPNEKVTLNANYSATKKTTKAEIDKETSESQWNIQAFYVPARSLSFFLKLTVVDEEDSYDTIQNYSANWSPFPDGDLQFFFTYSETLRSGDGQKQRTIGPTVKWDMGPHASLDVSYSASKTESELVTTDTDSFIAKLRILF